MVRNWDVIREILLAIEQYQFEDVEIDLEKFEGDIVTIIFNGKRQPTIGQTYKYHLMLLIDEGFIRSNYGIVDEVDELKVMGLSWYGHDFVEKLRDDKTWDNLKKQFEEKGIALTTEAISEMFTALIRKGIGNIFGS
jgi:hypothetical protein